ncbi:MAG: phage holin family protein [Acidobacteriaceae bacterium]|nr:phage holin family protein [Acidobacteriaceae bacterium]MBV8569911.1 phage holin family protein [Acidobacteriaceae bacterium]
MTEQERSFGAILHDVLSDIGEIVRTEIKLAKTELRSEATELLHVMPFVGIGALLAGCALAMALTACVLVLGLIMPYWAAALILFAVTAVLAGAFAGFGIMRLRRIRLKPAKTIRTLEENAQWLKTQTRWPLKSGDGGRAWEDT